MVLAYVLKEWVGVSNPKNMSRKRWGAERQAGHVMALRSHSTRVSHGNATRRMASVRMLMLPAGVP